MKMENILKKILKSLTAVIFINLITFCSYLLLLFTNILKNYELDENYEKNLPIFVFFFIFSLLITFLISIFIKLEKETVVLFLSENFFLGILSVVFIPAINFNCFGLLTILEYFKYVLLENNNENDFILKILTVILSTFMYYIVIKLGNKLHYIVDRPN